MASLLNGKKLWPCNCEKQTVLRKSSDASQTHNPPWQKHTRKSTFRVLSLMWKVRRCKAVVMTEGTTGTDDVGRCHNLKHGRDGIT